MSERLLRYTSELLGRCGAVIEPVGELDLELLAPPDVQAALAIGEHECLHFGANPPAGARRVGFEGTWLDGLAGLFGGRGRHRQMVLRGPLAPPTRPQEMVELALDLPNATWRLREVTPAFTRVLLFRFAYTATSDDRRDGTLEVALNLGTGSSLGDLLPPLLAALLEAGAGAEDPSASALPTLDGRELAGLLARALPARVHAALAPFLAGLRRRLERDRGRLHDYHQRLLDESAERGARGSGEPVGPGRAAEGRPLAASREKQRQEAIQRDARTKLADLEAKYALAVEVRPIQLLELLTPVQRFHLRVLRRKRSREVELDLFPFSPRLEPLLCEHRLAETRTRLVCDDAAHVVAPDGLAPCARCQRPYCRVCHPSACPKCPRSVG